MNKKILFIFMFLFLFSFAFVSSQGMIRDDSRITFFSGNLTNLYQLNDTNIPSPSNLDLLQFKTINNKWNSYSFSLGDFWNYDYNDLINNPTIPTNNNELINGEGYYSLADFNINNYALLNTLNNGTYNYDWNSTGLIINWSNAIDLTNYLINNTREGWNITIDNLKVKDYTTFENDMHYSIHDDGSNIHLDFDEVGGNNYVGIETTGGFFQLYANPNPSNDYLLATITEVQGEDTELNFYEGGTGHNRFWNSGSLRVGGSKGSLCSELTTDVDCDTPGTGSDLVVQDDGWFGGKLFSSDWSNISITESQINDFQTYRLLSNNTFFGNVGIGTTNPNELLQIGDSTSGGDSYIRLNAAGGGYSSGVKIVGGTMDIWTLDYNDSSNSFSIDEDGTDYLTILNGGNVGIGTTSPGQNIVGTYDYPSTVTALQVDGNTYGRLISRGSSSGALDLIDSGAGTDEKWMQLISDGGITTFRSYSDTGSLISDDILVLDHSNGNVGIGTNSPNEKFQINRGTGESVFMQITNDDTGTEDNQGLYVGLTSVDVGYIGTRSNNDLTFETNDILAMTIDTSQNVGIGTTSPSYPLEINGDNSGISLYTSGNISATGFITRTSLYDKSKSVWDYLKDSDDYKDKDGKIDHKKYYGYVSNITSTDYSQPINESYEEELCEQILVNVTVEKCTLIEDLFTNCTNVIEQKSETQCHNETKTKITYPYTKEEEGVNLESEINLLRQAIYELKQQNNLLISRIEVLENVK